MFEFLMIGFGRAKSLFVTTFILSYIRAVEGSFSGNPVS